MVLAKKMSGVMTMGVTVLTLVMNIIYKLPENLLAPRKRN